MTETNSIKNMSAPVPLGPGFDPHVAVERMPSGAVRLHIAWVDQGQVMYGIWAHDLTGGPAKVINAGSVPIGATDENGYPWSCLDLAVGPEGTVHLVAIGDDSVLYWRRQADLWAPVRRLHWNPRGLVFPVLAVHGGTVALAWQERCEPGDRGGAVLTLLSDNGGESWGAPTRHWAGGKNPRLKFSLAGVLYLLARGPRSEGHNGYLRWFDGRSWSEPERCTNGSGNVGIADLAVEPAGNLWVAWSDSQGVDGPEKSSVFLASKRNGQWDYHRPLYCDSSAKPHLHLACDEAGCLYLMNSNTVDLPPRYVAFCGGEEFVRGQLYAVPDASHFFDLKPLREGVAMVWTRLQDKRRLKEVRSGMVYLRTLQVPANPAREVRRHAPITAESELRRPIGLITGIEKGLDHCLSEVMRHGVAVAHLRTPFASVRSRALAWEIRRRFAEANVVITAVFVGFADEDYSSLETVAATVGLTPPERRVAHFRETLDIADFAHHIGVAAVGMHLGFLPDDASSDAFREMVIVVREICDHCRCHQQDFLIETGQESPELMREFILAVERANLRVSFDPANLLIYGTGDPSAAIRVLAPYVGCVHCKDARRRRLLNELDIRLGDGDVDFKAVFGALKQQAFAGSLIIERHRAPDRDADIAAAIVRLLTLRQETWGDHA